MVTAEKNLHELRDRLTVLSRRDFEPSNVNTLADEVTRVLATATGCITNLLGDLHDLRIRVAKLERDAGKMR